MEKTTVYFPIELKQRVKTMARRSGKSDAEIIRAAVEMFTDPARNPAPWPKSAGIGRSGRVQSEHVDDWMKETWDRDW
ncbi:MAG: CopG family transcriptional regulator [Thermomicrobiales bacterium]